MPGRASAGTVSARGGTTGSDVAGTRDAFCNTSRADLHRRKTVGQKRAAVRRLAKDASPSRTMVGHHGGWSSGPHDEKVHTPDDRDGPRTNGADDATIGDPDFGDADPVHAVRGSARRPECAKVMRLREIISTEDSNTDHGRRRDGRSGRTRRPATKGRGDDGTHSRSREGLEPTGTRTPRPIREAAKLLYQQPRRTTGYGGRNRAAYGKYKIVPGHLELLRSGGQALPMGRGL